MIRLAALFCGLLCGAGLIISGLFQPALLQGLANPAGAWDITLGLGIVSAFGVAAVILGLTRGRSRPLLGGEAEPIAEGQTGKAVVGGVLFGLGWGLAGFFPLAALVALGMFAPGAGLFLASVIGGMLVHDLVANRGRFRIEGLRSGG